MTASLGLPDGLLPTRFVLHPTTSGHPHTETYLSPVPQLPLQQTVQGERDDVVQVLNLEKAETPYPTMGDCPAPRMLSGTVKHHEAKDSSGGQGGRERKRGRWEG